MRAIRIALNGPHKKEKKNVYIYVYIYRKIIHFFFKNVDFFEKFEKFKLTEKHSKTTPIQKKIIF